MERLELLAGGTNGHGRAVVVLPGIQSWPLGQARGLYPALLSEPTSIWGCAYNTGRFDPQELAHDIARQVEALWRDHRQVILLGFSVGAPLSVLVVRSLRWLGLGSVVNDPDKFRVIMVDPPFGASTMNAIPDWVKPFAYSLFVGMSLVTPPFVKMGVKAPLYEQLDVPRVHDDWGMMFPDLRKMESKGVSSYLELARQADVENQRGHSLRTWFQQLAWLTGGATSLSFDTLSNVRVDLVTAISRHNTVVYSHEASRAWKALVHFTKVVNADAEHCATLRNQPEYDRALRAVLGS